MEDEVANVCSSCGSSVYKQHIKSGIARYEGDKLLCSHCVVDSESSGGSETFEPIEIEDDGKRASPEKADLSSSRIQAATSGAFGAGGGWDDSKFKRAVDANRAGATRCRMFHCKLSQAALDFVINQINEWLDANEDIRLKFVDANIGPFEGKHVEQNLIITVFY